MTLLARGITQSAHRYATRAGWDEGQGAAQGLETLAEVCKGVASNLLDKGLLAAADATDSAAAEGGTGADGEAKAAAASLYLADALEVVGGLLLDDRGGGRPTVLNVALAVLGLREKPQAAAADGGDEGAGAAASASAPFIPRLLEAAARLLDHALGRIAALPPPSAAARMEGRASLAEEARREHIQAMILPALALLRRLASRSLVLDSPFAPPPPPSAGAGETPTVSQSVC